MSKLHKIRALRNYHHFNKASAGIGIILFAVVGTILLFNSKAATPFASIEPEQGTIAGVACPVSDAAASGSSAVKFGSACAGGVLNLPRVLWEGGPNYWKKFPKADAAGWADPSFFPVAVYLGKPSHAAQYKALGVNTYQQAEHDGSTLTSMTDLGMFVLAQDEWPRAEVNTNPKVPGWFASDECDMGLGGCSYDANNNGVVDEYDVLIIQQGYVNTFRSYNDGRFVQANYGNGILGTNWSPNVMDDLMQLVDTATIDQYMYTSPTVWYNAEQSPYWPTGAAVPRSATYGWMTDRMKSLLNPADLHPNWMMVEVARPYLTDDGALTITSDQIEGAVWSAIIHEARGISYFQHNNNEPYQTNNGCGNYALVECSDPARANKITAVHAKIRSLAPVINTQSYAYNFNNATDTMLKTYNGSAYIFADIGQLESPGNKTFTLPTGINGTTVTVVGENRTITVTNRSFTDNFAAEYSHHVYQITL